MLFYSAVAMLLLIGITSSTTAQTSTEEIVVTGADTVQDMPITYSQDLMDSISSVGSRFVVHYANVMKYYSIAPIPGQLESLLGQIAPRFILQNANTNRELTLNYPVALIGDTTSPGVSAIEITPAGETSTTISWTTDEYADSTVECGTESGTYTMTFSDPLYVEQHAVTLTGLTAGTIYYCRVSGADLSGNTYQGEEFSFEQEETFFIYLPIVMRY